MIDTFPAGNVFPWDNSGAGSSLGNRAGGMSVFPGSPAKEDAEEAPGPDQPFTVQGTSVLIAGATILALLILLRFVAHHVDSDTEFKSIRVTFYNALVIGLAATVTIPLFKWIASRQPIMPLKAWIMAA